jgi:rRNA maturation endonuclease Nob1
LASNFAKDTGDYKTLSTTDMKVITFGVYLAKQNKEDDKVRKEPKPLKEFKP